jgi:hypothetical protein
MVAVTSSTFFVTVEPTIAWLCHLSLAFPPPRLGDFDIGSRGDVRRCRVAWVLAAVGNVITGVGVTGAARRAAVSTGRRGVDGGGADAGRKPG